MYYLMIYILLVLISPYFSALVKAEECRAEEYKTNDPLEPLCCPMCNKGSVVRRDCKVDSGTSCIPCGRETYMNEPNGLTKCFPCSSCSAEPGFVTVQECTSTSNAVCGVLDGYYCKSYDADSMCNLAEKHTKCAPGQGIKAPGTHNTDTECENCQQGYYSLAGLTCTTHTKCTDGQIQRDEGNVTKDVVCLDASRNHYASVASLITLLALFLVFFLVSVRREKTLKQPVQEVVDVPQPVQEVGDVPKLGGDSNRV